MSVTKNKPRTKTPTLTHSLSLSFQQSHIVKTAFSAFFITKFRLNIVCCRVEQYTARADVKRVHFH